MCLEEWRMIGKKYFLGKFMDQGEGISYQGNSAEVTKKTIDKVDDIWMDTYCIDVGCNREGIEPTNTL